jgi:cytochrome oxidase Cu insertion factor (SCO1/SenC/PrrC family)
MAIQSRFLSYLAPSRELQDFSLINQQGKLFGSADLRGRRSLMFFGSTNCPDFCPTTLTTLAAMQKRLRTDALQNDFQCIVSARRVSAGRA